jgi:hypothetical protein
MTVLTWNDAVLKKYEMGLSKGVLYVRDGAGAYPLGVPWYGLTELSDSPGGAEPTELFANNTKYATLLSAETFGGSLTAYTYPDEWMVCDGSAAPSVGMQLRQQGRAKFGLAYRTEVGSDGGGDAVSYKLHLVYGCLASPSESTLATINDSPETQTFSWDFTASPLDFTGFRPSSKIVFDSGKSSAATMDALNIALFGDAAADAYLPLPAELLTIAALV